MQRSAVRRAAAAATQKAAGEGAAARALAAAGAGAGRMLAWRLHAYGAPGEPRLEPARVPPLRAPDELLVRVHSSSVNPLDVAMIGGYGRNVLNALRALDTGSGGVEFPLVAGRDFAGEVVRAGAAARLRPGARVWGVVPPHRAGAHAQFVVVPGGCAGAAPSRLGAAAGGALYAALSAASALRAGGLAAGSGAARGRRVLLLGLGGAGHAALQLLAADGAAVVAACASELAPRALAAGAVLALDRHAPDYEERLVACGPYDCIVDCAGLGGAEAGARRWRFARYVTLSAPLLRATDERGLLLGGATAACALAAQCVAAARAAPPAPATAAPAAAAPAGLPPHVRWAFFSPNEADIELLRRRADSGQLSVCVEREFAWWEADAAYARQAAGHARGKLLIDFTRDPSCS